MTHRHHGFVMGLDGFLHERAPTAAELEAEVARIEDLMVKEAGPSQVGVFYPCCNRWFPAAQFHRHRGFVLSHEAARP